MLVVRAEGFLRLGVDARLSTGEGGSGSGNGQGRRRVGDFLVGAGFVARLVVVAFELVDCSGWESL